MKRPSNLIIAFITAVAGIFLAFAVGRIALWILSPPEVEIEEDYESRLYLPDRLATKQLINENRARAELKKDVKNDRT